MSDMVGCITKNEEGHSIKKLDNSGGWKNILDDYDLQPELN